MYSFENKFVHSKIDHYAVFILSKFIEKLPSFCQYMTIRLIKMDDRKTLITAFVYNLVVMTTVFHASYRYRHHRKRFNVYFYVGMS